MEQVVRHFGGQAKLALLVTPFLVAAVAAYFAWARSKRCLSSAWRHVCLLLLLYSLAGIFAMTLVPGPGVSTTNLVPGSRLFDSADIQTSLANIVGNFIMFVPVGMLAPECGHTLGRARYTYALGIAATAGIEIVQHLAQLGRASDVTDILLGEMGVIAGCLLNNQLIRRLRARLSIEPLRSSR